MTAQSGSAIGAKRVLLAAGGALAIGAGAVWFGPQNDPTTVPDPAGLRPANTTEVATPPPDTLLNIAPNTQPNTQPNIAPNTQPNIAQDSPDTYATSDMPPPPDTGFDLVRVDPEGRAVIAGHAAPDSRLELTLDGATLEQVDVGSDGTFVALLDLPVEAPATLGLMPLDATGAQITSDRSPQTVLIAPAPQRPAAPQATPDPATPDPAAPTSAAPQVLLADDQGITVLQDAQHPADPVPQTTQLVIDAITYDTTGDVALSGRGNQGAALRVYLDNQPIQSGAVTASGQWRLPLPEVDSGVYTLRVDELAPDGSVASRMETPFKREAPDQLAENQPLTPATRIAAITVQPGSTLWAIARDHLGDGPLYVRVFAANRDKIRDPDLIYPGQIFTIPDAK